MSTAAPRAVHTVCSRCGDWSDSAPNLLCGRIDNPGDQPSPGTYHTAPDEAATRPSE